MEFYRGNQVVVVAEKSTGNETVGSMWLETGVFTKEDTLGEVLVWAKKTGCTGKLILTVPRPDIDPLYE